MDIFPGGDETLMAFYAVEWLQRWDWKVFVTIGQDPSFLSYFCWLILKIFNHPLLALQLPPVLISVLTVAVGYAAARQYFSRSLTLILVGLLAFSYWPLLISRPLLPGILMPLWECSVFYFWARWGNASVSRSQNFWAAALGFCAGLGPYTFFAWPVLYLLIFILILVASWNGKYTPSFFWFFVFSLLAMLPFLLAAYQEGYGGHMLAVSVWRNFQSWIDQIKVIGNYLSALLWDNLSGETSWNQWGGFLNILLGSFFFLGVIELFRFRRMIFSQLLGFALFLSLLPGLLAVGVEFHRILLVLPFLLIITGLGIHSLVLSFPESKRIPVLLLVFVLSAGMDLDRFSHSLEPLKANQGNQLYQSLKSLNAQAGPGLIFSEMVPENHDSYSLLYMTYPFNAILHQPRSLEKVKWAALLTNAHYAPFLSIQFPTIHWVTPESDPNRYKLGIVPIASAPKGVIKTWLDFYDVFRHIDFQIVDTPNGKPRTQVLKSLASFFPSVPSVPFLQSIFFEKLLFNYSWEKTFHPEDTWTNWRNFSELFQKSFDQSYQDVVLCEKYGRLLETEGKFDESLAEFRNALKLNPQNEFLKFEIQQVISMKSGPGR